MIRGARPGVSGAVTAPSSATTAAACCTGAGSTPATWRAALAVAETSSFSSCAGLWSACSTTARRNVDRAATTVSAT
jgi:hypothetical protein